MSLAVAIILCLVIIVIVAVVYYGWFRKRDLSLTLDVDNLGEVYVNDVKVASLSGWSNTTNMVIPSVSPMDTVYIKVVNQGGPGAIVCNYLYNNINHVADENSFRVVSDADATKTMTLGKVPVDKAKAIWPSLNMARYLPLTSALWVMNGNALSYDDTYSVRFYLSLPAFT